VAIVSGCVGEEGPAGLDSIPVRQVVEEVRIGDQLDPDIGFSRIGAVDVDPDGNIYVFESQDLQIRKYDSDGNLIVVLGRPGEGPGEFRSAAAIGIKADTLWALETASTSRRMSLFATTGEFIGTSQMTPVFVPRSGLQVGMMFPQYMGDDGFLQGYITTIVGGSAPSGIGVADTVPEPRVRFDLRGNVVDTIGWDTYRPSVWDLDFVVINGIRYLAEPPNDSPLTVRVTDGRIIVERQVPNEDQIGVLRIARTNMTGDTVFVREYPYTPVQFNETLLDSIARVYSAIEVTSDGTGFRSIPFGPDSLSVRRDLRSAFTFPPYQPPALQAQTDSDGRLWLQREVLDGADRRWNVFGTDGEALFHVDLPDGSRLLWAGDRTIWTSETDALDVPWLVRYRLD
jgi:hypothetical protein